MEGPPPGIDLSESQQASIYGAVITLWVISVIVTCLRFIARRITHVPLWWDDWFMVLGFASNTAMSLSTVCWVVPHGLGKHVWAAPPDASYVWAKGLFMQLFFYFTTIAAVKGSLLCLYWRIFNRSHIRLPIYIIAGIVACWYIAVTLVGIFECRPISGFWTRFSPTNPTHPDCTINSNAFYDGNAIPNIITDAVILVLPLRPVWSLQLKKRQKVALTGIFALGVFVIIISILRLVWVARLNLASPDITWNFVPSETWSAVEPNIAVLCGNLPVLKPILNLFARALGAPSSSAFSLDQYASSKDPNGQHWKLSRRASFSTGPGRKMGSHPSSKIDDLYADPTDDTNRLVVDVSAQQDGHKRNGSVDPELGKEAGLKYMKSDGILVKTDVIVTETHSDSSSI
ncbi:MAG: hypothetical protein M1820_004079 [Bogoriella megaspora]|nr:MAG: hypothetical protein M1820_004079 [Bogoriella megaspora]